MVVSLPPKTSLDNVLSTSGLYNQSELWRSPLTKVCCLHVIFHFNGVVVGKQALSFRM
jgi:hypothetical protein